jgi:hypothetical protein
VRRRILIFRAALVVAFGVETGSVKIRSAWLLHRGLVKAQGFPIVPRTVVYLENAHIHGFRATRSDGAYVKGQYVQRPDGQTYAFTEAYLVREGRGVSTMGDIGTKQTFYPLVIAIVASHAFPEFVGREELHQLRENGAASIHFSIVRSASNRHMASRSSQNS